MKNYHHVETVKTSNGISIINLNEEIDNAIVHSRISEGFAIISSRHTTTAICINECEVRLLADLKVWLNKLAPADDKYLHNDIDQRPESEQEAQRCRDNGWDIDNPDQDLKILAL